MKTADRILLVDGVLSRRQSFAAAVGASGWILDLAADADEAVGMAGRCRYAAICIACDDGFDAGVVVAERLHPMQPAAAFVMLLPESASVVSAATLTTAMIAEIVRIPWQDKLLVAAIRRAIEMHQECVAQRLVELVTRNSEVTGGRVLLIEDNPGDAFLVRRLLGKRSGFAGFEVNTVTSLADALTNLEADEYDAVLVDLSLPDAGGLTAVARIRASAANVPLLVLSGVEDHSLAFKTIQIGAQDFLSKQHVDSGSLGRSIRFAIERTRARERLVYLANYDQLTGLPNRSLFRDRLVAALARARRQGGGVGLMFLDLDRFKRINDTMGHDVGDALLRGFSERLRGCLRDSEVIARLSGDEFVVILEDIDDPEAAVTAARRIVLALTKPFQLGPHEVFVTTSIGISLYPQSPDLDAMIRDADHAMYQAKKAGRNQFMVHANTDHGRSHLSLESDLSGALERGEYFLAYQPKVSAASGELVGAEALLRWRHPRDGVIPPGGFIPLLEETGMIIPVGAWVIEEACRQSKEWLERGVGSVPVAVNLSARQFLFEDIAATIQRLLADLSFPAEMLELELTESVLLDDTASVSAVLQRLSAMGLRLAIDDFGTGYSSLAYLQRYPIDTLKIDRSFVRGIDQVADSGSLCRAIIGLAQNLGMRVVGEGVETVGEQDYLRAHGCEVLQGFLIGRPMEAPDFERWLAGGYQLAA